MISVTSITDRYILQPSLLQKHKTTLNWLSAIALWKREVTFFQKLIDRYAPGFTTPEAKKELGHFQSLITYYHGQLLIELSATLRNHERKLAEILETRNESDTRYFKEHEGIMNELEAFQTQFSSLKEELFNRIEKIMSQGKD